MGNNKELSKVVLTGENRFGAFYRRYLGSKIPVTGQLHNRWTSLSCPFHDDKDPSAGVDLHSGVFNCYSCGSKSPTQFLVEFTHVDITEATRIVEEYLRDIGVVIKDSGSFTSSLRTDPKWDDLARKSKRSKEEMRRLSIVKDYCASRNISIDTLLATGVGYLPAHLTSWRRASLVFPYVKNGHVVGIRYRDEYGSKSGEPGCHFCLWGADSLEDNLQGVRYAVLVEGESDRLKAYEWLQAGSVEGEEEIEVPELRVVSCPTGAFPREWTREFEGYHKIVAISQDDNTGAHQFLRQAQDALGSRLVALHLPWRRGQTGKDLCDWAKYNSRDTLRALVAGSIGGADQRIMSAREFSEYANKPRSYLLSNLFARQQVAIVGGMPKAMKTWVVLNLIRALIHPDAPPFLDLPEVRNVNGGDCRILLIEEEGDAEELWERMALVFQDVPDWDTKVFIGHHLSVRLDEEGWIQRLEDVIAANNIDVLFGDPMQDLHSADENDAGEIGVVWTNIGRLRSRFRRLAVAIIHHFNKEGDITNGWKSLRGSIRSGASADFGIFVEKGHTQDGSNAIRISCDGRSLKAKQAGVEGILERVFDDTRGLFVTPAPNTVITKDGEPRAVNPRNNGEGRGGGAGDKLTGVNISIKSNKVQELFDLVVSQGGSARLSDITKLLDTYPQTVQRWVDKHPNLTSTKQNGSIIIQVHNAAVANTTTGEITNL